MVWLAAILFSDVLVFLSFPPYKLGPIMFVAVVPVFYLLEKSRTWKQAFFRAWLYVFIGNAMICFWVASTMGKYAHLPYPVGLLAVIGFSLVEQIAWPIMAALRFLMHKKFGRYPLLWTPCLLVALELVWPKFFPNTLGNALYDVSLLRQIADITGVWGLTALLIMTNEIIAAWLARTWPRKTLVAHTLVAVVVLTSALGYGYFRKREMESLRANVTRRAKVAMIQPNLNAVAYARARPDKDLARREALQPLLDLSTRALVDKPTILFWPETAVSNLFHSGREYETKSVTDAIDDFVLGAKVPLIFGARDFQDDRFFNAVYLVEGVGPSLKIERYRKMRLLMFGETIPLGGTFPRLVDFAFTNFGASMLTPGKEQVVFEVSGVKIGPIICFEGLYDRFVRSMVLKGADWIYSATNDMWFTGNEPALHYELTMFRAIETRRPILRATTDGLTAIIDIDGTTTVQVKPHRPAILSAEVPIYGNLRTPFLLYGPLFLIGFLVRAACPFAWRLRKRA